MSQVHAPTQEVAHPRERRYNGGIRSGITFHWGGNINATYHRGPRDPFYIFFLFLAKIDIYEFIILDNLNPILYTHINTYITLGVVV